MLTRAFGELLAWIIGWDLMVEYAIGNIAVAISWSDYFTGLLSANGINIPAEFHDGLPDGASRGYRSGATAVDGRQAQQRSKRLTG